MMVKFNPTVFNEDNYFAGVRYPNGHIDAFHVYKHNGNLVVFDYEFEYVTTKSTLESLKDYLNNITGEQNE